MTTQPVSVSLARNGKLAAIRRGSAIELVDAVGIAPTRRIDESTAFAFVGDELWTADCMLRCRALGAVDRSRSLALPFAPTAIRPFAGGAVLVGAVSLLVASESLDHVELANDVDWWPMHGRRLLASREGRCELVTLGQRLPVALPVSGDICAAAAVFAGRAIAIVTRGRVLVTTPTGATIRALAIDGLACCAIAEEAGILVGVVGADLIAVDLRTGATRTHAIEGVSSIAIDGGARRLALGLPDAEVQLVAYDDVFRRREFVLSPQPPPDPDEISTVAVELVEATHHEDLPEESIVHDDTAAPLPVADVSPPLALALHAAPLLPVFAAPEGAVRFASPADHAMALVDLVAARAALAIAEGWHSGRFSVDVEGGLPHEHEVLGLVGDGVGLASDALRRAHGRLHERAGALAPRVLATLAAGMRLPFVDVALEYDLSATAVELLALALAPRLRGDIGRLYGILAGTDARAACDAELAVCLIAGDANARAHVVAELAPGSALVRNGLVHLAPQCERAAFTLDDVLRDRLLGCAPQGERRTGERAVDELVVPVEVIRTLRAALAVADAVHPARIVMRGRPGSGRHTLLAAFASEVGCAIAPIDAARLGRSANPGAAMAMALAHARMTHAVPMVSGLERVADDEIRQDLHAVVDVHAGPVALRAPLDGELAIGPDHVVVVLPPLSIQERMRVWKMALARQAGMCLDEAEIERIATRFRFGAGTIERVADSAARRHRLHGGTAADAIDASARQHIVTRLGKLATRIDRLPDWDQVRLADDMLDSVRELVGRVRHQRVVHEHWGFDRRLTTGRGLAALFYGPPGTGKTLVAGLVARELGLDMWRVDLAGVVSKWIGETEKNLGELFDAAHDGQVMLLFDEADSLFSKRTDVKSSNDKHANLEVNYLLQRLDTFEGVCVLTTNLEKGIDTAFKRRMTMRMYFPFPDEDQRAQLWAAHVPPQVPAEGAFDFAALARRYPLSGGYIRNSALRAAFLAAQEQRPLTQAHLIRAVEAEYRELGSLSTSGRIE